MPCVCGLEFARGPQLLQSILSDGLQHPEARLVVGCGALHQAFLAQRFEAVQRLDLQLAARIGDLFGALERPASDERGQPPEESLLRLAEEIVAPVDSGRDRPMAFRDVSSGGGQEWQLALEALKDRSRR